MMETTGTTVLTCFPAGLHRMARRLHEAPPRWPVSGLAETTRVPFPGGTACHDAHPVGCQHEMQVCGLRPLTVAGAAQVRVLPSYRSELRLDPS